jgi:trigger factor
MAEQEMPAREDEPADAETAVAESEGYRLSLDVDIQSVGPCKKHVRVTVPRDDVDHFYDEAVEKLCDQADVPGFRKGHVPRKLVEKLFHKELTGEVKQQVLIQSLDQLSQDNKLEPINDPNLDVETLEIPDEGDFEFEFDVEVRPEFDLPDYNGLQINRPVREVTDDDVEQYLERFLTQYGQLVPHEGDAAAGDFVVLSAEVRHNGETLRKFNELTVQIKPVLRFADAELDGFDKLMSGAKAGDAKSAKLVVSVEADSIELRGETVEATFTIEDVKKLRLPELTKEFLDRVGVETEEELRKEVKDILERQVTYEQRQSTREQVLGKITESANWDLPEQLVRKQVENAMRRQILEMQQAGFTSQELRARENQLRQNALTTTRQALKEHFVLDKIATKEQIEVEGGDIDGEIRLMALQSGESPRRVRARLVKSGLIENLEAQIRERKAVDFILARAKFKDVQMERPATNRIEAVPLSICGAESFAGEEAEPVADDTDGHKE